MTRPRLECPPTLTPPHRLTWCALNQAAILADLLEPTTDLQREAQVRILEAARSGNLIHTYHAVRDACSLAPGRRIATPVWRRDFAEPWMSQVEKLILSKVRVA